MVTNGSPNFAAEKMKVLPLALQLQHVGALDLGTPLFGDRALGAPELQRGEAVAVDDPVGVRRVGVLTGADDQPGLAMRIDALARSARPAPAG